MSSFEINDFYTKYNGRGALVENTCEYIKGRALNKWKTDSRNLFGGSSPCWVSYIRSHWFIATSLFFCFCLFLFAFHCSLPLCLSLLYCLVQSEVDKVHDRQGSPCQRAYLGSRAGRERRKEKEVFINGLVFTDIYVSHEICRATSTKSTHLIGQPLAWGNKISCSGDCWTMDVFPPRLPEITYPCGSCVSSPRVLFHRELLAPRHRQRLATPAAVPGLKQRLGRCRFQDAGRNRQGM